MTMLIVAVVAYAALSFMEKSYEDEVTKCEETDWNAYYANAIN